MARVKRGVTAHARHKKIVDMAKGYVGRSGESFRPALQRVEKALRYAYRDRRAKKRDFRALWIQRINAGSRELGLTYGKLINGLKKAGVAVDRKVLAEIAMSDPDGFKAIVDQAKAMGAAGLIWARRGDDGAITSSIMKAMGEEGVRQLLDAASCGNGELLLVAAGAPDPTSKLLGQLRLNLAKQKGLLNPEEYAFLWVVDFPLLEWDPEDKRYVAMHHPFTSPSDADIPLLATDPGAARAKAYDLVLNGSEIGGGSIRIHDSAMQSRIFELLNISAEDAKARFGFFVEALEYGTPPHGGIALGLDRIVAILANESSIREVIAFPKTAAAVDLMSDAPSVVDTRQLRELHLEIRK